MKVTSVEFGRKQLIFLRHSVHFCSWDNYFNHTTKSSSLNGRGRGWQGVPLSSPDRGRVSPCSPDGGSTPIHSWWRVPSSSPDQGGGAPIQVQRGIHHPFPTSGYPGYLPSAGWGTPCWPDVGTPPHQLDEVLPRVRTDSRQTDRHGWKHYLPHSFGMRTVKMLRCNLPTSIPFYNKIVSN